MGTEGPGGRPQGRALGWVSPVPSWASQSISFSRQGLASAVQVPMPGTEARSRPSVCVDAFLG